MPIVFGGQVFLDVVDLYFADDERSLTLLARLKGAVEAVVAQLSSLPSFGPAPDFLEEMLANLPGSLSNLAFSGQLGLLKEFVEVVRQDFDNADPLQALELVQASLVLGRLEKVIEEASLQPATGAHLDPRLLLVSVPIYGEDSRVTALKAKLESRVIDALTSIAQREAESAGYECISYSGGWLINRSSRKFNTTRRSAKASTNGAATVAGSNFAQN